uniref:Mitochondrial ribosomal protein L13 n=1 Tax=Acrobeloides nanus TaxID=290746 RepID=A0A914E8C8_9BILA
MASPISRFNRVNQWLLFARQWSVIDAAHQDAKELGVKVARHLSGKHKPIWHPETDCGDHVVVINCKDVAMHGFDWKHTLYHFDKLYPKARDDIYAWQIHEHDPCRILWITTYRALGNNLIRRSHIERLHLFPDEDMPEFVKKNIGNQLKQIIPVARKSTEYTEEERAKFPRIVKFPEDHILDWHAPIVDPGAWKKPRYRKPKKLTTGKK